MAEARKSNFVALSCYGLLRSCFDPCADRNDEQIMK
jgi:hypothetical protein